MEFSSLHYQVGVGVVERMSRPLSLFGEMSVIDMSQWVSGERKKKKTLQASLVAKRRMLQL